jgi:hypothetical protein
MSQFVGTNHETLSSTATNELALFCNQYSSLSPQAQQILKPRTAAQCLYGSAPVSGIDIGVYPNVGSLNAGGVMSTYSGITQDPSTGVWSGTGTSLVDCYATDAAGNDCCSPNISTNFLYPSQWSGLCKHFLGAFISSIPIQNVYQFPPSTQQISAAPVGCCAYQEAYINSLPVCFANDNTSGVLNQLINPQQYGRWQLCTWSANFNVLAPIQTQQTFDQICRVITNEEAYVIAGDYKGGCWDWSAQRQDIIADATNLTCPRYGTSVTSSYTSPLSRFNSKSTYPFQPLDAACCAGMGTDCPATACFENPYCMDLLYNFCTNVLQNPNSYPPTSSGAMICNAWQEFGEGVTSGNQNGHYNVTADVAARVSLDYCRSINFTNTQLCGGLEALNGFIYDRLTPNLSVNSVTYVNSLTTVVSVQNASGRSVSNVNIIIQEDTTDDVNSILVNPGVVSFNPWATQNLTLTFNGTSKQSLYSFSETQSVVVAGINLLPYNRCSISSPSDIQNNRPRPQDYPTVYPCAEGDNLVSEGTSTSEPAVTVTAINRDLCTEAYTNYAACARCWTGPPYNTRYHDCAGGVRPSLPTSNECKDSSQFGCPFCFIPGNDSMTQANWYIKKKKGAFLGSNQDPIATDAGCGCQHDDGKYYEQSCGSGPDNARRGLCSPQTLTVYDLGAQRTCSGIDATISVLFSTRTDLQSRDFPVMGGFVAAYQPTGLVMDFRSYQVAVYPYTTPQQQ